MQDSTTAILDVVVELSQALTHGGFAKVADTTTSYRDLPRKRESNQCRVSWALEALAGSTIPETEAVVRVIAEGFDDLVWYPVPDTVPDDLLDRLTAAEFIGPDGAIQSSELRLGVFFVAADTVFPSHRHDASEHYVVLVGRADWNLEMGWVSHGPGEVIEVPSRAWHSIRTADSAMVCLYTWTGDTGFGTYEF